VNIVKPDLETLYDALTDFSDPRASCFLCGVDLRNREATSEHVIPVWAQRRFELWDQHLTLLNGTSIPYRALTVPCCAECNKYRLKPLEDSIAASVDSGRDAIIQLGSKTLFLWLGKIFYGILYKELMLLSDRANPASGSIITNEFIDRYRMHRLFLQQAREVVEVKDFLPGSLFIFNAQRLPEQKMCWDLVDNVDSLFIGVRVGDTALLAAMADGGAQQTEEAIYEDFFSLRLHPLQFRELCARISYRSMTATRTPKYIIASGSPHLAYQMPLGGLSAKPLFEDFDPETYAAVLRLYTGQPLDRIYQHPQVMTWLRDEDGRVRYMDFHELPILSFEPR
jgi:hypothetical protein